MCCVYVYIVLSFIKFYVFLYSYVSCKVTIRFYYILLVFRGISIIIISDVVYSILTEIIYDNLVGAKTRSFPNVLS